MTGDRDLTMAGMGSKSVDGGCAMRHRLREATRAVHDRLHHHPRLRPLLARTLSLPEYAAALEALYGFQAAVERVLNQGNGGALPVRAPLILRDLAVLGLGPPAGVALPEAPPPAVAADPAARLGCRYVMTGSFIGGRLIAANVARTLNLGPDTGAGFFGGGGEEADRAWAVLLDELDTTLTTEAQQQAAIAAAVQLFTALADWLDRPAGGDRTAGGGSPA